MSGRLPAVIIPAAGSGTRTGLRTPKTFLAVSGVPLLALTVGAFERHRSVGLIQAVLPASQHVKFLRLQARFSWRKVLPPVTGGRERQVSVFRGLQALPPGPEIVMVHDAARPLVDGPLIARVIRAARRHGAAIAALPVADTVKRSTPRGTIQSTMDRRRLWLAQTPQAFRADLLLEAHRRAAAEGFLGTDDASLVERTGQPVFLVPGSLRNMKVTTRDDLAFVRRLAGDG